MKFGLLLAGAAGLVWGQKAMVEGNLVDARGGAVASAAVACGEVKAKSDAEGRFQLRIASGGKCRVSVAATGYYVADERNLRVYGDVSKPVQLRNLVLQREARLGGVVKLASGEPMGEGQVFLLERGVGEGAKWLRTVAAQEIGRDGKFVFGQVRAGKYYLMGSPKLCRKGVARQATPTFYPASGDWKSAVELNVEAGEAKNDLVIGMLETQTYQVTGRMALGAVHPSNMLLAFVQLRRVPESGGVGSVVLKEGDLVQQPFADSLLRQSGAVRFDNVLPGRYDVTVFYKGSWEEYVVGKLEVTDHDVVDLKLQLPQPTKVRGKVVLRDFESATLVSHLEFDSGRELSGYSKTALVDQDGNFEVDLPLPGRYAVYTQHPDLKNRDIYVAGVTWNGKKLPGGEAPIGLKGGTMLVELVMGTAKVAGMAPREAEKVVLFPMPLYISSFRLFVQADVDERGNYELERVLPGKYYVCATGSLEHVNERDLFRDAGLLGLLDRDCVKVDVGEKAKVKLDLKRVLEVEQK